MKTHPGILTLVCAGLVFGCDAAEKAKEAASPAATPEAPEAPKVAAAPAATPTPPPEPEPEKLVEHDLSSAHAEWAGWKAQGPEGAKVMADGVKGARIAANGRDAFDLAWAPKKKDLGQLKKNIEKGVAASEGKRKVTWTKDEPGHLEWVDEGYGAKRYNFVLHMNVEGRDVSCSNNIMMGIASETQLEQHKEACKTLKKG